MPLSRLRFALLGAIVAALVPGGSASAAPAVNGVFDVSETPKHLTLGPDGNIWAAVGGKIAKVTPAGVVTEYDPTDLGSPHGITAGPDGNLWATESAGVVRIPPNDPLTAKKFAVAKISDPREITTGPDGNLWTASGDQVIKIPPADPTTFTAYPVTGMSARGIASGGDGNLWVADFFEDRVASVTTAGAFTSYPVGGGVQGIAAGPGTQIAYANPSVNPQHVGRIVPGGTPQKSLVPGADPFDVTFGPDGAYWFAEFVTQSVGRMTTDGQVTRLGGFAAGSGPRYLTAGPGNTLWVSLETSKQIGRITGVVAPVPPPPPPPGGTGAGADTQAPAITGLSLVRRALRARTPTRLRYSLSEPATVRFVVHRLGRGKRPARRVGSFSRKGAAGPNVVRFKGRIGRKALRPGRYRLTATAKDAAGNVGPPQRVALRILPRYRATLVATDAAGNASKPEWLSLTVVRP